MSLTRVVALASSVALGAGMLAVLPLMAAPADAATPTITAVGSLVSTDAVVATTTATLSVSTAERW